MYFIQFTGIFCGSVFEFEGEDPSDTNKKYGLPQIHSFSILVRLLNPFLNDRLFYKIYVRNCIGNPTDFRFGIACYCLLTLTAQVFLILLRKFKDFYANELLGEQQLSKYLFNISIQPTNVYKYIYICT